MLEELLNILQMNLVVQLILSVIVVICAYLVNKLVLRRALDRFAKQAGLEDKYVKPVKSLGSLLIFVVAVVLILS